jgi:hypothetical protein
MIIGNDRIACLIEISRIQENLFALHRKASSLLTGAFFALRPIVIYYLLCCLVWFLFLFGCQRSVTLCIPVVGASTIVEFGVPATDSAILFFRIIIGYVF